MCIHVIIRLEVQVYLCMSVWTVNITKIENGRKIELLVIEDKSVTNAGILTDHLYSLSV